MKVYGQLERAQIENLTVDPTGANLVEGLVWFRTDLNLFRWYDGAATREAVDLDSVQTLINKTLTAPAISDPEISGVTTYDEVVATPSTPAAGKAKLYLKDDGLFYKLDPEGNEIPVGSGSGGGLDVFHTEDFEINNAADFSSGNNASFQGGGSLAGTLADETVAPISKNRNLKYTQAAGSLNDYVSSPIIEIDPKQAGNDMGLNLYFKYDGDKDDIQVVIFDDTNDVVISSALDLIESASNPTRFGIQAFIPAGVTELRWGFQVKVENIGAILEIDDVELTMNPFSYKNLVIQDAVNYTGFLGTSSARVRLKTEQENTGNGLLVVDNSTHTRVTALRECYISAHFCGERPAGGHNAQLIVRDSSDVIKFQSRDGQSSANNNASTAMNCKMNPGDYIVADNGGDVYSDAFTCSFSVRAIAESEHVVTPAKSKINSINLADNAGESTTANVTDIPFAGSGLGWDGDSYEMQFDDSILHLSGCIEFSTNSRRLVGLYVNGTRVKEYVSYDVGNGSQTSVTKIDFLSGKGEFSKGDIVSFRTPQGGTLGGDAEGHYLAITESPEAGLLAAVPVQKTAIIEQRNGGVTGQALTGVFATLNLNTLKDSGGFASLDSDQITIPAGEYIFDIDGYFYYTSTGNGNVISKLANVTDGTDDHLKPAFNNSQSYFPVGGKKKVTLTKPTTFEWQARLTGGPTCRFGDSPAAPDDLAGQIFITKIR